MLAITQYQKNLMKSGELFFFTIPHKVIEPIEALDLLYNYYYPDRFPSFKNDAELFTMLLRGDFNRYFPTVQSLKLIKRGSFYYLKEDLDSLDE